MNKLISYLLLTGLISSTIPAFSNNMNFEVGVGIPYGVLGGNANFDIGNSVELFAGLGMAVDSADIGNETEYATDLAYSLGARYYIASHIRLTAAYGTIGSILTQSNEFSEDIDLEAVKGRSIGIGYYSSKDKGFVADIMYIDTKNFDQRTEELESKGLYLKDKKDGEVMLSLGYRF
jgi:hypothetical protein